MGGAGLTLREGMDLCKRRRPEVDPIPAFVGQLKIYESRCREMGKIQSTNGNPERDGRYDRKEMGMKRKASEATIGPARGPARGPTGPVRGPVRGPAGPVRGPVKGPIGPVRGPARGPIKGVIGPTKNPMNYGDGDDDRGNGNTEKTSIIGPCLPSEDDDGANGASSLLEEDKASVKCVAICSQKKSSVSPLLQHLKDGDKANSSIGLKDAGTNCDNDNMEEVHTITTDSCLT